MNETTLNTWQSAGTLESLFRTDRTACAGIPDAAGVYRIVVPEGMQLEFLPDCINKSATPYTVEKLSGKFATCQDKRILYIGKASGKRGLRQRIHQYVKYGWNEAVNHKGGRAIWQIKNAEQLLLEYLLCNNSEDVERDMLREFRQNNTTYPLANWKG